jgi:23S rRNA (cytosine1962-C5)-methyltransferase
MAKRRKKERPAGPRRRAQTVRVPAEIARRVRDGHPWIFSDALRGRVLPDQPGKAVDIVDPDGRFVGRALIDSADNIALRVFSRRQGEALDRTYLQHRVEQCLRMRRRLLDPAPDACFRLINGDSEGVPAVSIDAYGPYLVACCYSPAAEVFLEQLIAVLADLGAHRGLYLQRRHRTPAPERPRPGAELMWGEAAPAEVVVTEHGVRYVVDVSAPASPGLYPDMRLGRLEVGRIAAGARVLNCFSYTGAFSVVAALRGAREVVSVDASARAHGRARRNFSENALDHRDRAYDFITGDTFATLTRLAEKGRRFELVILDPPTFSSSKGRTFTALKDYGELVASALAVLEPGGTLCAASNAVKLSAGDLDRSLGRGASLAGRDLLVTRRLGQPPDYPVTTCFSEGAYLKLLVARTP